LNKTKFNALKNITNYTKTETTNYTYNQTQNSTLPTLGRTSRISLNTPEYYQRKLFENTDYRLKCSPPIYYYRKVTKPYKYSMEREPSKYSSKETTENIIINRLKTIINKNFGNFENFINKNERFKNDKFKPEGYLFYDWIIKHPQLLNGDLLASKFIHPNRKKIPTYEDIKKKFHHSDILTDFDYENKNTNKYNNDNYNYDYSYKAYTEGNVNDSNENMDKEKNENNKNNEENQNENENENKNENENEKEQNENNTKSKTFYNNNQTETNNQTRKTNIYKYRTSDIFNLNPNTKLNISKSGEKYLQTELENKNKIHFNKTVSNSAWYPKIPKRHNYMGYTSVKFNIISPGTKSFCLTKEDILKGDKPSNKVKSISEFIDLCRVSAPNIGKNHENYLKENKSFGMKNGPGTNYLDMHKNYRELINKPF